MCVCIFVCLEEEARPVHPTIVPHALAIMSFHILHAACVASECKQRQTKRKQRATLKVFSSEKETKIKRYPAYTMPHTIECAALSILCRPMLFVVAVLFICQ